MTDQPTRRETDLDGEVIVDQEEPAMFEPSREERQGLGDVGRHAQTDTAEAADVGEREPNR